VVNLLLEGDDLEALLLRAHREGGTAARIVRAQKVRRGGILGFFAKEGFEVAVEIPKDAEPDGEAAHTAGQWAGEFAAPTVDLMPPLSPPALGSEGLLDLADRASIAEQAATRAITRANTQASLPSGADHEELAPGASAAERLVAKLVPSRAVPGDAAPIDAMPIDAVVVDAMRVRAMIAGVPSAEPDPPGPEEPDEAIVVHAVTFTPTEFPHLQLPDSDDPRTANPRSEFPRAEPQSLDQVYSVSEHGSLNEAARPTDLSEVTEPFAVRELPANGSPSEPPPANRAPVNILDASSTAIATTIGSRVKSRRAMHRAVPVPRSAPGDAQVPATGTAEIRHRTAPVDDRSSESAWQLLRSWRPSPRKPFDGVDRPDELAKLDQLLSSNQILNREIPSPDSDLNPDSTPSLDPDLNPDLETWPAVDFLDPAGPGFTDAATQGDAPAGSDLIATDFQLSADRQALRTLGVPAAWTEHLHAGDRFSSIVAMLAQLPEPRIRTDAAVIAVVGPADVVELEAQRAALDLPASGRTRSVTLAPGTVGIDRRTAVARSKRIRPVVISVPIEDYDDPEATRTILTGVKAETVIVVVDASRPLAEINRWVHGLEQVDAIALAGGLDTDAPAAVLGLGVPVIRVDGIAVDRIGWAALLCAHLSALDASR
jgi:hypothetical protein